VEANYALEALRPFNVDEDGTLRAYKVFIENTGTLS
jgi:hypothetical protein